MRSENSKTLSVWYDIVNIFFYGSMELIKLKKLSKSSLECSQKTNIMKTLPTGKLVGVHGNVTAWTGHYAGLEQYHLPVNVVC